MAVEGVAAEKERLPDFVVIGAMKSATTSLYRWLDEQPEVFMAHPKDSGALAGEWSVALRWYAERFADAGPDQLLGEASVSYTDPRHSPIVADRMARSMKDVRLVYVLRQPVDRIRSHYRHEVQRRREHRPLLEAIAEPGNPYVAQSCYFACLEPYIERFPREQILVVRFEDLVRPDGSAWSQALAFLSLSDRPVPEGAHNVSSEKARWTRAMAWAHRNHVITLKQVSRLPKPVRRLGRAVFAREQDGRDGGPDASRAEIPFERTRPVWEDMARLESWLGLSLWSPGVGTSDRAAS